MSEQRFGQTRAAPDLLTSQTCSAAGSFPAGLLAVATVALEAAPRF